MEEGLGKILALLYIDTHKVEISTTDKELIFEIKNKEDRSINIYDENNIKIATIDPGESITITYNDDSDD